MKEKSGTGRRHSPAPKARNGSGSGTGNGNGSDGKSRAAITLHAAMPKGAEKLFVITKEDGQTRDAY